MWSRYHEATIKIRSEVQTFLLSSCGYNEACRLTVKPKGVTTLLGSSIYLQEKIKKIQTFFLQLAGLTVYKIIPKASLALQRAVMLTYLNTCTWSGMWFQTKPSWMPVRRLAATLLSSFFVQNMCGLSCHFESEQITFACFSLTF